MHALTAAQVYVPLSDPSGYIEGTVARAPKGAPKARL